MESHRKNLKSYIIIAAATFLLVFILSQTFMLASVDGISMEPTLDNGQQMLVLKCHYHLFDPEYNDLVVIDYNASNALSHKYIVKRIIGLPGDQLEFKGNQVYRNGKMIDEPYLKEIMIGQVDKVIDIPQNKIFVLGDNRNESIDSRHFGYIDVHTQVVGKVLFH